MSDLDLLTHPYVVAEHPYDRRLEATRGRARLDRKLRDAGLGKHVVRVERWEKGEVEAERGISLAVVWPTSMPGFVSLDLSEWADTLAVKDGEWASDGAEKGDTTSPLVRIRLAVEPGDGEVRFAPVADALYDKGALGRFEGAVFDVDLTVKDERGRTRARLVVSDVPIVELMSPDMKEVALRSASEGPEWELEAALRYVPRPIRGATKLLDEYQGAMVDGVTPTTNTLVPLLGRQRFVSFGVTNDPKQAGFTLMDRIILGVHVQTGWHGKERHDRCIATVSVQVQGKVAHWFETKNLELKTTTKAPKGPRRSLTWKQKGKTFYVDDVVVEHDGTVAVEEGARNLTWRSTYFLVPEKLAAAGRFTLKDVLDAARAQVDAPLPLPDRPGQDHVVFSPTGWEKYSSHLKNIVQKIALIEAWRDQYAKLQEKWKGELDAYVRVVTPVVRALDGIQFSTRNVNWGGRSDTKLSQLHRSWEHAETWKKALVLQRIDQQIARHAAEALQLFRRSDFQDVFFARQRGGDPYLGAKLGFGWGLTRDRLKPIEDARDRSTWDSLDVARGGDTSVEPYTLTIKAASFQYDGWLKAYVLMLMPMYLVLTARAPAPADGKDPSKLAEAQQKRIELFNEAIAPGLNKVFEALSENTQKKQVDFLTEDFQRAGLWHVALAGAPCSLMYARGQMRTQLNAFLLVPDEVVADALQLSDEALERNGQALMKRATKHGFTAKGAIDGALGTIKWVIDVHRFTTGDLGWNVDTLLDAADLAVATGEVALRAGALSGKLGAKLVLKSGTQVVEVVGKVGAWIDVLKEAYSLYKQIGAMIRGKPTEPMNIILTGANLVGLVFLAIGGPLFGGLGAAVIGLVILVRGIWDAFRIVEREQVPAWYSRTVWAEDAHYDYEDHLGALARDDAKGTFKAACAALTIFFSDVWEELSKDKKAVGAIREYFGTWATTTGKGLGLTVEVAEDADFFKLVVS